MDDPHDRRRFVAAQAPVFDAVAAELTAGRKRSHRMWFVFPQVAGLGFSPMARRCAIRSLDGARADLAHPALGERLRRRSRSRDPGAALTGRFNEGGEWDKLTALTDRPRVENRHVARDQRQMPASLDAHR